MPAYLTPGVYFEWLDPRPPSVVPDRTDITGFVGIAVRGPLHQPTKVESWTQFASVFGTHTPQGYLAYAVEGFFLNGGRTCWVVRVADPQKAKPASIFSLFQGQGVRGLLDTAGQRVLDLEAYSPGVWGDQLGVSTANIGAGRFSLTVRLPDGTQEYWPNLTFLKDDPRFVESLLNDQSAGSRLVRVTYTQALGSLKSGTFSFTGGEDGLTTLKAGHLSGEGADENQTWGLATLEAIAEIAIVAIPDIMPTPHIPAKQPPPRPVRCDLLDDVPPRPPVPQQEPEFPPAF